MVNNNKIRQKINILQNNIKFLDSLRQIPADEFLADPRNYLSATRILQISVEAMIDIANHIIARESLGVPQSYHDAIKILTREGYLPNNKEPTFRAMIRFRNRAVHMYDEIDEQEIYRIICENLNDFQDYMDSIIKRCF
ncbi:MAG: DUF86 domain-containing protein [Syntrophomonas sp.]|nr:DUF86 domain-containing protein [Syntrophomonas sp.]MDD3878938.1 DUF86 domain-containing protein [Syntrophomonas sp.]